MLLFREWSRSAALPPARASATPHPSRCGPRPALMAKAGAAGAPRAGPGRFPEPRAFRAAGEGPGRARSPGKSGSGSRPHRSPGLA